MAAGADSGLRASRLAQMAQRSTRDREQALERCDLCNALIGPDHRHLLELERRELRCTCRACALLFDRAASGGGHYRLVPDRRLRLDDFALDALAWEQLRLPVDLAFFFHHSGAGRVMAFYPGPMGATESLLGLDAWRDLEAANPVLRTLAPDVEALLVNRARGAHAHLLVPIDDCFALVGLIRTHWKGLTGGRDVWEEIGRFFAALHRRARPAGRQDASPPSAAAAGRAEGS
jgi:Family of unknown function (DUF5947)